MNKEKQKQLLTTISVLFLIGLAVVTVATWTHDIQTKNNSKFRYTIVELTDYYHKGKVRGKEIRYSLNGVTYDDHCRDDNCEKAKVGDKYLIKVYLDDPKVFEIIWTNKITDSDSVPLTGWESISRQK